MKKKKKKNSKKTLIIAIVAILFTIIALIGGSVWYTLSSLNPTKAFLNGEVCDGDAPCEITPFIVDEGAYGKSTLVKLEEQGILKNANITYYWNRIFGGFSFYAGYFEIPHTVDGEPITMEQILAYISNPDNAVQDTVMIRFDEGDFIRSYADLIGRYTTVKSEDILAYWNNEEVVRGYMSEYPFLTEEIFNPDTKYLLEGYLFPDAYEFFQYTNEDEITRKFLDRTLDIYNKYIDQFNSSKLSVHEIFTLASMVQWESGDAEENALIAGVFMNRLENPDYEDIQILGSTVTACYAFDLTKDECAAHGDETQYTWQDNPYNTYTNSGLPPGPVCCPNEISIYGVLNADQSAGYYYFIGDICYGTGTVFARTAAEHESNIAKYISCQ
ncbi:MAG: endolytic transglycosylase MltG [Erysipelotrichaceae bacterium]|nr:endolytic transglycosylase MltG [Erysipelotrichaceae bacterium]